jgi:hypothetical protein
VYSSSSRMICLFKDRSGFVVVSLSVIEVKTHARKTIESESGGGGP